MSADLMLEAIALSSPSGRMSKRARKAAEKRLDAMFAEQYKAICAKYPKPEPSVRDALMFQAKQCRNFAQLEVRPRIRERFLFCAEWYEYEAGL